MPLERKPTITPSRRQLERLRNKGKLNEPKRRVAIEAAKKRVLNHDNIKRRFLEQFGTETNILPTDQKVLGIGKRRITVKLGQFFDPKNNIYIYIYSSETETYKWKNLFVS